MDYDFDFDKKYAKTMVERCKGCGDEATVDLAVFKIMQLLNVYHPKAYKDILEKLKKDIEMAMLIIDHRGNVNKVPECEKCCQNMIARYDGSWICTDCDFKKEETEEIKK